MWSPRIELDAFTMVTFPAAILCGWLVGSLRTETRNSCPGDESKLHMVMHWEVGGGMVHFVSTAPAGMHFSYVFKTMKAVLICFHSLLLFQLSGLDFVLLVFLLVLRFAVLKSAWNVWSEPCIGHSLMKELSCELLFVGMAVLDAWTSDWKGAKLK